MILYYFTHLLIFICINAQNETFISPLLKIIIPAKYYQKLIRILAQFMLTLIKVKNIANLTAKDVPKFVQAEQLKEFH